jgi:hypothetical protein
MTRFQTWLLLTVAGFISVPLGVNTLDTAAACTWFSGVALSMHYLFGRNQ